MIRKLCLISCGIALTWLCAVAGLFVLADLRGPLCHGISKVRMAHDKALELEMGLERFYIDNDRCPGGTDELIRGHYVTARAFLDSWGTAIAFSCSHDDVRASSAGPDRIFGTADDITTDSYQLASETVPNQGGTSLARHATDSDVNRMSSTQRPRAAAETVPNQDGTPAAKATHSSRSPHLGRPSSRSGTQTKRTSAGRMARPETGARSPSSGPGHSAC
jgi:hypothetical protein